jgi:hypothetical protein
MSSFGFGADFAARLADVKSSSVSGKSPPELGTGGGSPPPPSPFSSSRYVLPVIWSSELCGGRIGTGGFVCCLRREDCGKATHKTRAADIEPGTLFVPESGGTRFHKDNCLMVADYPPLIREALCLARPFHEHRRLFDLVRRSDATDLESLDSETLPKFLQLDAPRLAPATPGMIQNTIKKPRPFLAKLEGVSEEAVEIKALLGAFEKAVLQITDPLSPSTEDPALFLTSQYPKIREAFVSTEKLVKALYGSVAGNHDSVESGLLALFTRMEANLSEVFSIIGDFDRQETSIQPFGFDFATVVGGLANGLREVQSLLGVDDEMSPPAAKKVKLVNSVEAVTDKVAKMEKTMAEQVSPAFDFLLPEVKRLQSLVSEVAASKGVGEFSRQPAGSSVPEGFTTELLFEINRLKAAVAALEVQKTPIPDSVAYKISGQTFKTLDEVKLFLHAGGPQGLEPGNYYDCFSVAAISVWKDKTVEEMMSMQADASKVGLPDTVNGLAVLTSFTQDRPPLVGVTSEKKSSEFPLPRVKTFEDWYHPAAYSKTVLSAYDHTHDMLELHLAGFEDAARFNDKLQPLVAMAKEMLLKCKKFIQELSRQVEGFRNMVLKERCSEKEAWLLISEMLEAVFVEIHKARIPFGDSLSDHREDKLHRCALVLIGTFRAHAKMEEIWRAGFTKHSCVSTCMSLHLFREKASHNRITALEGIVKDLASKVTTLQKTVQSQFDQQKRGGGDKGGAAKKAAA